MRATPTRLWYIGSMGRRTEVVDDPLQDLGGVLQRRGLHEQPVHRVEVGFDVVAAVDGVACVAVAVGYRIPATDAVSCSMPAALATGKHLDKVVAAVSTHTNALAATLRREGIR